MPKAKLIDRLKSLEELDGENWGDPDTAETPMISRVRTLRRKPIESLTNGELRLAVAQRVGFPLVLELALERLRPDPLLLADFYPGDVLAALVRVDEQEWGGRNDLRASLAELYRHAMEQSSDEADAFRDALQLPRSERWAN